MRYNNQVDETKNEVLAASAKRHAEMATMAAAANDRVRKLEGELRESEYRTLIAEAQLGEMTAGMELGEWRLITAADTEPEGVDLLLGLGSWTLWAREKGQVSGNEWVTAGSTAPTREVWPIGFDAGPFLAVDSKWRQTGTLTWLVDRVIGAVEELNQTERALRGKPGHEKAGMAPSVPELAKAVVLELEKRMQGFMDQAAQAVSAAEKAERRLKGRPELIAGRTAHELTVAAQRTMLSGCEVPDDGGDPWYSPAALEEAAALLNAAAAMERERETGVALRA